MERGIQGNKSGFSCHLLNGRRIRRGTDALQSPPPQQPADYDSPSRIWDGDQIQALIRYSTRLLVRKAT